MLKILNCKYPQNLLNICANVEKTKRRVYYVSIGLQWSDMFYAEFIAPPKPGIKDKKHLFRLSINGKFMVKKQGTLPSEVYSSTLGEIGHATPSGRSVRHFVFF